MAFGETFVTLCLQTMVKEDYGNKQKRKQHNSAVDAIRKLSLSLRREEAAAQLEPLLSHKDSRVRVFAASACGEWDVLTNKTAAACYKNCFHIFRRLSESIPILRTLHPPTKQSGCHTYY